MSLGKQIKKYRQHLDWTLEKLEEESGVPKGTISALEVRDSDRSKYAPEIARAFGVSVDQLMNENIDASETVNFHEKSKGDDGHTIRQFNTGGGMGNGLILQEQSGIIENFRVSSAWLYENIKGHSSTKNLCIVTGYGESMKPLFNPGDPVIVDLQIKEYIGEFPYFFRIENEGFISDFNECRARATVFYLTIQNTKRGQLSKEWTLRYLAKSSKYGRARIFNSRVKIWKTINIL